uniref:Uncharacterized protein n=1 Tax=Triticum urartu TaxID=4572 RepID=A0A8R7Q360_TRIUA
MGSETAVVTSAEKKVPWIEKVGEHAKRQHTLGAAVTKLLRILDSDVVMMYTRCCLASNSRRCVVRPGNCRRSPDEAQ